MFPLCVCVSLLLELVCWPQFIWAASDVGKIHGHQSVASDREIERESILLVN